MQDFLGGLKGFPQREPSFVSRLMDVRGGTITGIQSNPFVSVSGSWNTTSNSVNFATFNLTEKSVGLTSGFLACSRNGLQVFQIGKFGSVVAGDDISSNFNIICGNSSAFKISSACKLSGSTDGKMLISNAAGTDFTKLQFGGISSSFPSIGRNGTALVIQGADSNGAGILQLTNVGFPGPTNFERIDIQWTANVAQIWTEAGGSGNARDLVLGSNATELQRFSGTSLISWFAATPVAKQTSGANLTNNAAASGTTDQIDDFTSLTVYATDAQAIHNDIYQLARKLKQINDGLRSYGLFT